MTAASIWLVAAVLTQIAIAFVLLWVLGAIRVPLVAGGKIPIGDIALSREPWPEHEKRVSNAFDNQFQLPVVFYAVCGLSLYFGVTWVEVVLAWLFVLARFAHAAIFSITNNVAHRFVAYSACFAALGILWLDLVIRLISIATGNH